MTLNQMGFASGMRQANPWLWVARICWVLNLAGNGIILVFLLPRNPLDIIDLYEFQIAYPGARAFFGMTELAWFVLGLEYLILMAFVALAVFLFWRKSDDLMAIFSSALFIGIGIGYVSVTYMESPYINQSGFAWLEDLQNLLLTLSLYGLGLFIFIFPDGRFAPRSAGRFVAAYILFSIALLFVLFQIIGDGIYIVFIITLVILVFGALASQVYRYKFQSTPIQRQQLKLVVSGSAAYPILGLVYGFVILPLIPPQYQDEQQFVVLILGRLVLLLIPITITVSILRYRLWDIDILIRRTLVFSSLTVFLALVYFSGVTLLQGLFFTISNQQSPVSIVISTLAIAALFNPLRRRIQDFIDRRFYRRRYDVEKALAEFAAAARSETDLAKLCARLTNTVQEALQPDGISLWMVKNSNHERKQGLMKNTLFLRSVAMVMAIFILAACNSDSQQPTLNPTEGAQMLEGVYTTSITQDDLDKIQSLDPNLGANVGDWMFTLTNSGEFNAEKDGQFMLTGVFTVRGDELELYIRSCDNCGCENGIGRYTWALKDDQLSMVKKAGVCDGMDLVATAHPLTRQP